MKKTNTRLTVEIDTTDDESEIKVEGRILPIDILVHIQNATCIDELNIAFQQANEYRYLEEEKKAIPLYHALMAEALRLNDRRACYYYFNEAGRKGFLTAAMYETMRQSNRLSPDDLCGHNVLQRQYDVITLFSCQNPSIQRAMKNTLPCIPSELWRRDRRRLAAALPPEHNIHAPKRENRSRLKQAGHQNSLFPAEAPPATLQIVSPCMPTQTLPWQPPQQPLPPVGRMDTHRRKK
ncbi:MAG TPA: hypothetical protein VLJ15_02800 [Gammaproteobacteria bacterium]|nr:hypothetical protein [Gammaproteobacteria bacterium]